MEEQILNRHFILIIGKIQGMVVRCGFLNVYAPNDEVVKALLWTMLLHELKSRDVWCCVLGDFNTIRYEDERIGKSDIHISTFAFSEFINDAALMDMIMVNGPFTWCNRREEVTFSRLDRFLLDAN